MTGGFAPNPWYPPYPYQYPHPYQFQQPATGDTDSNVTKPDKFTGKDSQQFRPFLASCIMAFNNKPRKFQTDRQRVAYAASYLSDIAMSWWQPILSAPIEAPIRNNWLLFIQELNNLFGEVDIEQTSERALNASKCSTITTSIDA